MKLYYSPGACSLSPHITLYESGLPFEMVKVDFKTKTTEAGNDYTKINPKGAVPALALDDGSVLTEGPAIVQFVADKAAVKNLAPANGSTERYACRNGRTSSRPICTRASVRFSSRRCPTRPSSSSRTHRQVFRLRRQAACRQGLPDGQDFSVADGYLFVILTWAERIKIDTSSLANLTAYKARIATRPAVVKAMTSEELLKAA